MSDQNKSNEAEKPQKKSTFRNMMGFLSQKGIVSTASRASNTKQPISIPPAKPQARPIQPSFVKKQGNVSQTNVNHQESTQEVDSLEADRFSTDGSFINNSKVFQELKITANAARSLTSLFSGLSITPGSGSEIPSEERKAIINRLIDSAHELTNRICAAVMGESNANPPEYLRAMVLRDAAQVVGKQWEEKREINIEPLVESVQWAVTNQIPSFTQNSLDLLDQAETFTPANTSELSELKINHSIYNAQLNFIKDIERFYAQDYDPNTPVFSPLSVDPFIYGRSVAEVSTDLLRCTLNIVDENKIITGVRDIDTLYQQNAIARAQTLVASQYRKITDSMLKVAFENELESESALSYANTLYDEVIQKVQSRARDNFILIEKSALDVMKKRETSTPQKTEHQDQPKSSPINAPSVSIATTRKPPMANPVTPVRVAKVAFKSVAIHRAASPASKISVAPVTPPQTTEHSQGNVLPEQKPQKDEINTVRSPSFPRPTSR